MTVVANSSETEARIPRDLLFDMLSNRRRRWVLHALKQQESERVSFETIVETVSAWEYETDPAELTWKQRKRIYTALRQSHLPKLDEAGIISYDQRRGTVELTDQTQQIQLYLEYVPSHDVPWSYCYLAFACLGFGLNFFMWASVGPFGGLSGVLLIWILVGLFGVTAVVHTYHTRQNRLGTQRPRRHV